MAQKKFVSNQTYPDSVWAQDRANPFLQFNMAVTYSIGLGIPIPSDHKEFYHCGHCHTSAKFWIEKNNKNCFKCIKCNSIVETT